MTQIQSGILPEHRRFAIFIEAMIQGEFDAIRLGCKKFCQSLQELQARFPDARRDVAIIADDRPDAGGSYVFVQRWDHNLKQLQRVSVEQQEQMIGRTKQDNEEIPAEQRPITSHLSRVDLKDEGKGLKILRQCMPYGTASGSHFFAPSLEKLLAL